MSDSRKEVPISTNEHVHYYGSADSGIRISRMSCGELRLTRDAIQSLLTTLINRNPLLIDPREPDATLESTVVRVLGNRKETPLQFPLYEAEALRVFAVLRGEGIVSSNGREFSSAIQDRAEKSRVSHVNALEGRRGIFCERGLVDQVIVRSVAISQSSGNGENYCKLTFDPAEEGMVKNTEVRESFEVGSRMHSGFVGTGGLACPYVGWRLYTAAHTVNDVLEFAREHPDRQIRPKDVRDVIEAGNRLSVGL